MNLGTSATFRLIEAVSLIPCLLNTGITVLFLSFKTSSQIEFITLKARGGCFIPWRLWSEIFFCLLVVGSITGEPHKRKFTVCCKVALILFKTEIKEITCFPIIIIFSRTWYECSFTLTFCSRTITKSCGRRFSTQRKLTSFVSKWLCSFDWIDILYSRDLFQH